MANAVNVEQLSRAERDMVVAGLDALLAAARRARVGAMVAKDNELVELRDRRIAAVEALILKFR